MKLKWTASGTAAGYYVDLYENEDGRQIIVGADWCGAIGAKAFGIAGRSSAASVAATKFLNASEMRRQP